MRQRRADLRSTTKLRLHLSTSRWSPQTPDYILFLLPSSYLHYKGPTSRLMHCLSCAACCADPCVDRRQTPPNLQTCAFTQAINSMDLKAIGSAELVQDIEVVTQLFSPGAPMMLEVKVRAPFNLGGFLVCPQHSFGMKRTGAVAPFSWWRSTGRPFFS